MQRLTPQTARAVGEGDPVDRSALPPHLLYTPEHQEKAVCAAELGPVRPNGDADQLRAPPEAPWLVCVVRGADKRFPENIWELMP